MEIKAHIKSKALQVSPKFALNIINAVHQLIGLIATVTLLYSCSLVVMLEELLIGNSPCLHLSEVGLTSWPTESTMSEHHGITNIVAHI